MITKVDLEQIIYRLPDIELSYPFGDEVAVYQLKPTEYPDMPDSSRMVALLRDTYPVKLSLRCDPKLAALLRDKYETVLPGENLNKKHWNTIICTGQVELEELSDLVRHSYELTKA